MRIEKRDYRVFCRGKRYTLTLWVCEGEAREKLLIRRKLIANR